MERCAFQKRSTAFGFTSGIVGAWKRLMVRYKQRRALKQQMAHLREMDDRLLKDIGLTRSDVDRITGTRGPWDPQVHREQDLDAYRWRR